MYALAQLGEIDVEMTLSRIIHKIISKLLYNTAEYGDSDKVSRVEMPDRVDI